MAQGQVQGGALQVREAHKSINPEGYPQRFRGDRESIPTAINIWIIGPIPPCPTLLRTERSAVALRRVGGPGVSHPGGEERMARGRVSMGAIPPGPTKLSQRLN